MLKVGINGFGRIGRLAARIIFKKYKSKLELVCVNTSGKIDAVGWSNLFKHDTAYGKYPGEVSTEGNKMVVDGLSIPVLAEKNPSLIPWGKYGTQVVTIGVPTALTCLKGMIVSGDLVIPPFHVMIRKKIKRLLCSNLTVQARYIQIPKHRGTGKFIPISRLIQRDTFIQQDIWEARIDMNIHRHITRKAIPVVR